MNATGYALLAGMTVALALASVPAVRMQQPLNLVLEDHLVMPMTGTVDGSGNLGSLARINSLREEPGGTKRFFVNDLNGPLYIVGADKTVTPYLDFNGRDAHAGLFHRFTYEAGYANGLIAFQFDPAYATNGRFYTVHLEDPATPASAMPDNRSAPGLSLAGYKTTEPIRTPGDVQREAVLIEWTDTDIHDTTFEGTAREV